MKLTFVLLFITGVASTNARDSREEVTPVQKVIQLLNGMMEKGKKEKHDEQVQFAAYKQFCDDTSVEKQRSVEQATQHIEILKADIGKAVADAAQLGKEIASLDQDDSVWKGDIKAATKVRQIEKADYAETHKDYSESVDALQRAIAVLQKQAFDRKQKSSLAQVASLKNLNLIPEKAKKIIDAFLSFEGDNMELVETQLMNKMMGKEASSAPEANAYEFQSHGVIEMLEKLLDKFIDERSTLEKEEMNSKHAYDMLMQDLKAQIDQATTDRGEKAVAKAKTLQAKADNEGDLQDSTSSKAADEKYLSDLKSTCQMKASDFEQRQEMRSEEIVAIEKAIEILSSGSVAGNAQKYLPSAASSFSQLRSTSLNPAQQKTYYFLSEKARSLNSRVLSALAVRVEEDPFSKVKKLIKDLIVRLMEEANEETEHKGWCDTEISTNEQTRKEKTEAVQMLHAEIDELKSSVAQLTEDISDLSKSVAELDQAMATATEQRQKEKAENEATIKDASEAQTAVAQALVVLKEFYAKAAESTALVQRQPDIFDSPYKGMGAESGGVLGMLEVIESDFARLEAETSSAEATGAKTYDTFMTDSKVDKAQKSTDSEHKAAKKQDQEQALTVKSADLEGTQKELDAALSYYDKLKPSCVDSGVSYDDRVNRRKEEIESLQEALKILNGESI
jgi:septal ring factor EnvC (AmiA/AmiB activator)